MHSELYIPMARSEGRNAELMTDTHCCNCLSDSSEHRHVTKPALSSDRIAMLAEGPPANLQAADHSCCKSLTHDRNQRKNVQTHMHLQACMHA